MDISMKISDEILAKLTAEEKDALLNLHWNGIVTGTAVKALEKIKELSW